MFAKSPTKTYHAAVKDLQKAEADYSTALDNHQMALDQRRAGDVPGLRRKADAAENSLKTALAIANDAWRSYWHERRYPLETQLQDIAHTMKRYDAISLVINRSQAMPLSTPRPASRFVDAVYTETPPIPFDSLLDDSGVPIESPDSELLGPRPGGLLG